MRARRLCRLLLLAHLLALCAVPRLRAADGFAGLKPMVTLSFDSGARLLQSVGLGFEGAGFAAGDAWFRRQFAALLLVPGFEGIDLYRPGHVFLLSPDPPDKAPLPAALLPLADQHGEELLAAMKAHFGAAVRKGNLHTFSDPVNPEDPGFVVLAMAEGHALVSTQIDGLRWLALHRRDRTLPEAADLETPLRLAVDGGLCGLFLQLVASLSVDGADGAAGGAQSLNDHLREIGAFCTAFASIDLGFDAGIREFGVTLRLHAPPASPLAARLAGLQTPPSAFGRQLPMPLLNGEISVLPALLPELPATTAPWLERLADSTQLLGLRVAPCAEGWVKLLLPVLNGQHASGLFKAPGAAGLCGLQIFGFDDARKAEAALSILESLLPTPAHPSPRILPLPPRIWDKLRIIGYQVAANATTNSTDGSGLDEVLVQMLGLGTVEMACQDRSLVIVRGARGTLEELLRQASGGDALSLLDQTGRRFAPLRPSQTLLGAGQCAPIATLRAAAGALPSLRDALGQLPFPGDALCWRAVREGDSLVWELVLPSNELMAWSRLPALDAGLLQELLTQFALEQFSRSSTERSQQDLLRERMRRLRDNRSSTPAESSGLGTSVDKAQDKARDKVGSPAGSH